MWCVCPSVSRKKALPCCWIFITATHGQILPINGYLRCYSDSPVENWNRFIGFLQLASKACREVCPKAAIIIHTERSGDPQALKDIYSRLSSVDYDIIGLSYYPIWHNSLSVLSQSLDILEEEFPDRKVQIVETAYHYQWQPPLGQGASYDFSSEWPVSPEGHSAFAKDLIKELRKHPNVNGLYWWFPERMETAPTAQSLPDGSIEAFGIMNHTVHCLHCMSLRSLFKDLLGEDSQIFSPVAPDMAAF